jgi:ribosomal protein S12 methylthiotransferase
MKVGMVSLGCPKNQVDSEVMAGLMKQAGHTVTSDELEAEAIVVNTCAFIKDASEESIETILEIASLKDRGKLKYLITAGCLAQRYKEGLVKELPEVDAYLGTGEFDRIAEVLESLSKGRGEDERCRPIPVPRIIYSHDTPRIRFTPRHWSYLKIADGCDNRCTYCIIPALRGNLRSRPVNSIVEEARILSSQGVKELCLIAQDITAYGAETKSKRSITGLLKELEKVRELSWIRLLYAHPAHFSDELIEFLAGSDKVVRYLDIPIQHADDEILKKMGRKITSARVLKLIDRLRKEIPGLALRTSLMVGFPGETKEKFLKLLRFVKEVEFDHVGVFGYSDEESAASAKLPGKVSEELTLERRDRIMKAQNKISLKKNKEKVGKTYKVLVDGPSAETDLLLAGRAYFQAPEIDGVVYINGGSPAAGEFADVLITEAHPYDLVGTTDIGGEERHPKKKNKAGSKRSTE